MFKNEKTKKLSGHFKRHKWTMVNDFTTGNLHEILVLKKRDEFILKLVEMYIKESAPLDWKPNLNYKCITQPLFKNRDSLLDKRNFSHSKITRKFGARFFVQYERKFWGLGIDFTDWWLYCSFYCNYSFLPCSNTRKIIWHNIE